MALQKSAPLPAFAPPPPAIPTDPNFAMMVPVETPGSVALPNTQGPPRVLAHGEDITMLQGPSPTKASKGGGGTRVSKQDSQDALTAAIEAAGAAPNEDIISKLTGKAAVYFTEVINGLVDSEV